MVGTFINIHADNIHLIEKFLSNAGDSVRTFRYYEKRPLSIIENHLYTCVYAIGEHIAAYGHLDRERDITWLGIAVSENYKQQGIGKQMMKHLLDQAALLQVEEIRLSVDKDNLAAKRLYDQFGFSIIESGERTDFYRKQL